MNLNMVYTMRGGEGKTALAMYIAFETGAGIITNEEYTILEEYLPSERLYILKSGQAVPKPKDDWNALYDLAGAPDSRVLEIAEQCQNVIIPVSYDDDSFKRGFGTIAEIEKVNKNIVIVANCMRDTDFKAEKVKKGESKKGRKKAQDFHFDAIKEKVEEYFDYPVYPLFKTKSFQRIRETKKSVSELLEQSPFPDLAKSWFEPSRTQMENIMEAIGYDRD